MFIYIYWIKCDFVLKKCIIFIKEGVNNFCNINDKINVYKYYVVCRVNFIYLFIKLKEK